MASSLEEFRFPTRDADIWGLDEDGQERDPEDIAADLEFNQRSVEDYLSNTLPNVYIQQSALGAGTIDPTQLATGTAGTGKAPVSAGAVAPAWTDIATQAELNVVTTSLGATVAAIFANDIQRGRITVSTMNGTSTTFAAQFTNAFSSVPRLVVSVECGQNVGFFPTLTIVNTTSFVGMVFVNSSTTATAFVHYHAIKQ